MRLQYQICNTFYYNEDYPMCDDKCVYDLFETYCMECLHMKSLH